MNIYLTILAVGICLTFANAHETLGNPILHANKFEGDIDGIQTTPTSQPPVNVWGAGVVPFKIDTNIDSATVAMIFKAISEIRAKTCVKFVPAKAKHTNLVYFKLGDAGCYTKVGRQGGEQNVVLEVDCAGVGTILHLLMHVLGFFHESARVDRDSHVSIKFNNVAEQNKKHFGKYVKPYDGQEYDYESITHLPKESFAKDPNQPTITRKNGQQIPDWTGLSQGDVDKINYRYCQGWSRSEQEGDSQFQNDQACPRCRRSLSKKNDNRKKNKDKDRRRGNAADRHHERHGHGHGATGHGHRDT